MPRLLIDTDVFSFRHKADSRANLYDPHLKGGTLYLCFATVAELYRWALSHNWGKRRVDELREEIRQYTVIPYDDALAWEWARLNSIKGRPIESGDAWIAATALRHHLPLVTHNRRHYLHIPDLQIVSASP